MSPIEEIEKEWRDTRKRTGGLQDFWCGYMSGLAFALVALMRGEAAASAPEGAKPKAPCCGHPYASHDIGKGCTEAGCVCLPGWLPVADPPRAPEAPKAWCSMAEHGSLDCEPWCAGRPSRAPSQEPETT